MYKVRGAQALWHMDANEKLFRWGFYIHGAVDGHSRFVVYLECRSNKSARTVANIFVDGVQRMRGPPSRVRGDYGTENNEVERIMTEYWGEEHKPYLRGRSEFKPAFIVPLVPSLTVHQSRSTHNVRIERLWRDIRKDVLDYWRLLFTHLEAHGLLDIEDPIQKIALFLVYQPRIQAMLDAAAAAWNSHQLRTEGHNSPQVLWHLSRSEGMRQGYWNEDPGDDILTASDPLYGVDGEGPLPPNPTAEEEIEAGIREHDDTLLDQIRESLPDLDFEREDGNRGMNVYQQTVRALQESLDAEDV